MKQEVPAFHNIIWTIIILILCVRTKYRITSDSRFVFSSYIFLMSDNNKFSFALGNINNATVITVFVLFCLSYGKHTSKVFVNFIPWLSFDENQLLTSSGVLPLLLGLYSVNKFTLQR